MQKLALKEKTLQFKEALKSQSILSAIRDLRSPELDSSKFKDLKDELIQLIITSKSNYDNLAQQDLELIQISDALKIYFYRTDVISKLITAINQTEHKERHILFTNSYFMDYYITHESIRKLNYVIQATIKESQYTENVIIFTLVSRDNPTIAKVVEVLNILQELIDLIEEIFDETQENSIYLLDKGSNTNIGIETGIKTAKSLFAIFKEVWDWVVNRKYYKEKLRNAAFMENMEIISKISDMKEAGILSKEDADRYKERILKKTDELISLNSVPRQLLLDNEKIEENKLLLDYNEVRLLKDGKIDDSKSDS